MSRSGYSDDITSWSLICWRGAVASAIRGQRGQEFLTEMLAALDALPAPRLISDALIADGEVCALGSVGVKRGIDMHKIDPHDSETIAGTFDIAEAMAREIEFINDDGGFYNETPEQRFTRVRAWVVKQLKEHV